MKRIAMILLVIAAVLLPACVYAEAQDDYEYQILEDGSIEITRYTGIETDLKIPSQINGRTVTSIGEGAFAWEHANLTSVTIPNSVETIGDSAFLYCTGMKKVTLPEGIEVINKDLFNGCEVLESVRIPNSVTEIKESAFYGCSKLSDVQLSNNLKKIGNQAFASSTNIVDLVVPNSVEYVGENAFIYLESLEIGEHFIGLPYEELEKSFGGDPIEGITEIIVSNGVKSLNNGAFKGYYTVDKFVLPDSLVSIGDYAFYNCYSLKKISVPSSVKSIGDYAFAKCDDVYEVNLSKGIISIGERAFADMEYMSHTKTHFDIPSSVKFIGIDAFSGLKIVHYEGTCNGAPWGALAVHEHSSDKCMEMATIFYATEGFYGSKVYTGKQITPEIYVQIAGKTLKENIDYKVTYDEGRINAGKYKITATGIGKYKSQISKTFTITRKNITKGKLTLKCNNFVYDGKIKKPIVTVKNNKGVLLKNGVDYTLRYDKSSKNIGEYHVAISGKGNYSGVSVLTYSITPKAPKNYKVQLKTYNSVRLSWEKSYGADRYDIYQKEPNNTKYKYLASTEGNKYDIKKLKPGKKYSFKVVPVIVIFDEAASYGEVEYYNIYRSPEYCVKSVTTLKKLNSPKVYKSSAGKVKIKWNNIAGETGYQISKSTKKSGTANIVTVKGSNKNSKVVKVKKGKKYYYKVRAYKVVNGKKVYGPWSNVKLYKLK